MAAKAMSTRQLAERLVKGLGGVRPGNIKGQVSWTLHRNDARRAAAEVIARKTGVTLYLREQPKSAALRATKVQLADAPARVARRAEKSKWAARVTVTEENAAQARRLLEGVLA